MTISTGSLYSDGSINIFSDGSRQLTRRRAKYVPTVSDFWHTLTEGQSLFELANQYYGSESIWWLIADANSIVNPLKLSDLVGRYLLIPNYDTYSFNAANASNQFNNVIGELAESLDKNDVVLPSYYTEAPTPSVIPNTDGSGSTETIITDSTRNARAFFLMPNGGYRLMTVDSEGTITLEQDDPSRYTDAIIFEQPI